MTALLELVPIWVTAVVGLTLGIYAIVLLIQDEGTK